MSARNWWDISHGVGEVFSKNCEQAKIRSILTDCWRIISDKALGVSSLSLSLSVDTATIPLAPS